MSNRRTFLQGVAAIPFARSISAAVPKAPQVHGYGETMPDMLLAFLQSKTNALAGAVSGADRLAAACCGRCTREGCGAGVVAHCAAVGGRPIGRGGDGASGSHAV